MLKTSSGMRKRLLEQGLLKEVCGICGIGKVWNGKPLTLQLDHIDGNNDNNTLENVRLLCPNCHSQTHTFAGKNKSRK